MKRKQCLAYILALCILISLVPVFSASASTLAPGQIIADGIYYIRNLEFDTFLKVIDKEETLNYDMYDYIYPGFYYTFHEEYNIPSDNAQTTLTKMDARFLWKVEYLGNGEYAITSMFKTDFMLTPGHELENERGVPLGVMDYRRDEDASVPIRFRWTIQMEGANRYALQWIGDNGRPFAAEHPNECPLPFVMGDGPNSGAFEWDFIPAPEQIMFYSSSGMFTENPVYFVAPEQTLTLEEMGLEVILSPNYRDTNNIRWSYSDEYNDPDAWDIAYVDSYDGSVTGGRYGECTITATYTKNGQTVSNNYTLKVAPLPAGEYYIKNVESELFIDSCQEGSYNERHLVLNAESTGLRSQKWTLVHIEKDEYYILLEIDDRQFYLTPADGELLENGASIVLNLVEQDSVIPRWQIGVTEDGYHTIMNPKDRSICIQYSERNEGQILQGTSAMDNHYDEWVFERAKTLRVQVYFDLYVNAYDPIGRNGVRFIEDKHLAIARQYFWEQFRVSIEFTHPQGILTYYEECTNRNSKGECECSSYCYNSEVIDQLQNVHHSNISNILLRVPMPQDPIDVTVLFIGHPTCYAYDSPTCKRLLLGMADRQYGLIAVNNIGVCPYGTSGECQCDVSVDHYFYSVESSVKTLIHEIGHIFGAIDHYGGLYKDSRSTSQMRKLDKHYNENCIYGENKEQPDVLDDFLMCEACRKNIEDGIEGYFNPRWS